MINVIGLGYIGLPTALILASSGLEVIGTDYNEGLVKKLSIGELTFNENGLEELFKKLIIEELASLQSIKVQTCISFLYQLYQNTTKKLDPQYVISAVNTILDVCLEGAIIIIESTVSPGSIDKYIRPEIVKRSGDW